MSVLLQEATYGHGQRGIMLKVDANTNFKAVVITGSLLWWSLMAAWMGAWVLSMWIYAPLGHLEFACEHFINCPMYDGSTMGLEEKEVWQNHLSEVMVVFFDHHPHGSPFQEVWTSQSPHMIVVNQGWEVNWMRKTRGWHVWSTTLRHLATGGVTDQKGCFTFYVQDQQRLETLKAGLENAQFKALRQDLRCVLKASIPGIPMQPTKEDLEHKYKMHVVWVRKPKVISSAGLLPWPMAPGLRVHAVLGGMQWVTRPIETHEVLSAMDVPDHMSAHREKGIGRQLKSGCSQITW